MSLRSILYRAIKKTSGFGIEAFDADGKLTLGIDFGYGEGYQEWVYDAYATLGAGGYSQRS